MPISNESNKILPMTNGLQKDFSFTFKFFQPSDIQVSFWAESGESFILDEGTHYNLIYTDPEEGGFIELIESSAEAQAQGAPKYPGTPEPGTLLIERVMPLDQQANIRPVSGFPEEVITDTFDKLVMIDQQQQEQLDRCIKVAGVSEIKPEALVAQVERIHEDIDSITLVANNIHKVDFIVDKGEDILNASEDSLANANAAREAAEEAKSYANASEETLNTCEGYTNLASTYMEEARGASFLAGSYANTATQKAEEAAEQAVIATAQAEEATKDAARAALYSQSCYNILEDSRKARDVATEQAGISTAQANIATEQAEVATNQASLSASHVNESQAHSTDSKVWAEGTDAEVQALGGLHSAKTWAEIVGSGSNIDETNLVHKDGTETITGPKTFTGAVNLIGSGDSNAVGVSTNTRFNVHNTNKTVLGFGSGVFYINHGDYRLRLRGKDARPHYNSDTNYLALLSDIPTDYVSSEQAENALQTKQDVLIAGENITIEDNVISATGGSGGSSGSGMPIGTIYSLNCTENYVPEGSLPCNGAEYSTEQFKDFWDTYLKYVPETKGSWVYDFDSTLLDYDNSTKTFNWKFQSILGQFSLVFEFDDTSSTTVSQSLIQIDDSTVCVNNGIITVENVDTLNNIAYEVSLPNEKRLYFTLYSDNGGAMLQVRGENTEDYTLLETGFTLTSLNFGSSSFEGSIAVENCSFLDYVSPYGEYTTFGSRERIEGEKGKEPLLITCTYNEYEQEISTYGFCDKFGVDGSRISPVSSNSSLTFSGNYEGSLNDTLTYSSSLFGVEIGTNCLNNNGVVSNFSTNIRGAISFTDTNSFSEFVIKINTGTDIDTVQGIYGNDVSVCISGGYLGCNAQSSNGIFIPVVRISQNQDIWIKVVKEGKYAGRFYYSFTGDESSYIKINNDDMSTGGTFLTFGSSFIGYGNVGVGTSVNDSKGANYPFLGFIDLNNSYYTDTQGETHYFYSADWSGDLKGLTVIGTPNNGDTISFIAKSYFKVPTSKSIERYLIEKKEPTEADMSWYNLYSDGWIEQGGTVVSGAVASYLVTYPIEMKDLSYTPLIAPFIGASDDTGADDNVYAILSGNVSGSYPYAKSTTQLRVSTLSKANAGFNWRVEGYVNLEQVSTPREFIVVANGSINQSQMDWSEWASGLNGKVNTSLNNLSEEGKKVIDGQWVQSIVSLGTQTAIGTYLCDISAVLPNDGYDYEVMLNLRAYSSNSSNAGIVYVYSDIFNKVGTEAYDSQGACGGYSRQIANTFILPVGTGRTITYEIESYAISTLILNLWGYRRIGTNQ